MNTKTYKMCEVPMCGNTSIKAPDKLYIYVPHSATVRQKWFKLAGVDSTEVPLKSKVYFCEDHFDVWIVLYLCRILTKLNYIWK